LHGVGGGAWSWKPQIAAFASAGSVYVWEGRGHGAAARVADAGLGDYFTDAQEALGAIIAREKRPAVVVGHSMGGLLALALAAEQAAAVRALALVDPVYPEGPAGYGLRFGPFTALARAIMTPLARSYASNNAAARAISRRMFTWSFEDRDAMERAWVDQQRQVPVEYPRMIFEALEGPSRFPRRMFAEEIAVPVLLLEGTSGAKQPRFQQLDATLRTRLGEDYRYAQTAGGHYLQLDRPDFVTEELRGFLTRIVPR
jgi:pimeloyl-ACP methyl ester carboxylesterase